MSLQPFFKLGAAGTKLNNVDSDTPLKKFRVFSEPSKQGSVALCQYCLLVRGGASPAPPLPKGIR